MVWAIVTLLVALVFVVQAKLWKSNDKKKLPPGPLGFPILGSLHLLGKLPHHDLLKLAQKYGPIMHIRLGQTLTIVASSPRAAELFLKTHDLVFASRPALEAAKHMTWDQRSLILAPYGDYWRNMRKMCTVELLSTAKISSFLALRREEVNLMIESIREAAMASRVVDLSAKVASLYVDVSCRMIFGKKYSNEDFDKRGFKDIIQEGLRLCAIPHLADFFPFLAPLDLQGYTKRMKELSKVFDDFFEKIIDEHVDSKGEDGKTKDFVDFMLGIMGSKESEYRLERPNIKAMMLDMLVASVDTTAATVEWAMSELMKKPRILKKLQEELQNVVGMGRMVEESDLEKLDYLDMVIKETFRLHPVAPLLVPHAALEDCTVDGFHIPKNSRVLINTYAIGRDPNAWTDPENFSPERFVGTDVDVKGRYFQLLPFGSGRRGCAGMQLGYILVKIVFAQLLHCFDWKLPNGVSPSELDMEEDFGLATPRANHLMVVPTYRLKKIAH